MQLYEIRLPLKDNSGKACRAAHRAYQVFLLDTFEGYSATSYNGAWRDDSGKLYLDRSIGYQVASGDPHTPTTLLYRAGRLFPDQLAFFWARLGEAHIVARGGA